MSIRKLILSNNVGLAKSKMIMIAATVVIVAAGGIFLFNNNDISSPGAGIDIDKTYTLPEETAFDEMKLEELLALFPEGRYSFRSPGNVDSFFQNIDTPIIGEVQDPGIDITSFGGASFSFNSLDINAISKSTGITLPEGDYSLFVVGTEMPVKDPLVVPQLGMAFGPITATLFPGDPLSQEPILRSPHATSFFGFADAELNGWQETLPFDLLDNYAPLDDITLFFGDPNNSFWALMVPQKFVGQPGHPGVISVQMFGRQTLDGEFPTLDDPTGVSGGSFFTSSIPDPLAGGIFADGFESGDTSAWSDGSYDRIPPTTTTRSDQDKKLPVLSAEELQAAIALFNDDEIFDDTTADLFSERFGILEPLPPARGTYFFDEFESFR